jgi:hypothetical protein
MKRQTSARIRLVGFAVAGLLAVAAWPASGQDKPAPPRSEGQAGEQLIQQIQKENEAVLSGRRFTYDPAGRRDPFEPLVKSEPNKPDGKRPKGVAGMLITEIDLRGVATDVNGLPVALFRGTDNRPYSLRVGDIVYDGRVISIDPSRAQVVFRQQVDDPRRIKPFRDVIKRLQVTSGEEGDTPAAEEEGA